MTSRRRAPWPVAAALLLQVATAGHAATSGALPRSPGGAFQWSADGSTLLALELDPRGVPSAARAFDGATGAPRWELAGESAAPLREALAGGDDLACVPSLDGGRALFGAGGRWWLWTAEGARFEAVDELAGGAAPRFAFGGDDVAFMRDGDLWLLALADRAVTRVTADGAATRDGETPPAVSERRASAQPGFAWSPDGQRLAFYRWSPGGALRLAIADRVDAEPRELALDADGPGLAAGWNWRPDARALAVLWLPAGAERLELRLCHPERMHCRMLAGRPRAPLERVADDLLFLEDGFLWGSATTTGALALYDALGRERRLLVDGPAPRVGIVASYEATREVAVAVESTDLQGSVRLLLVDLRGGTTREIARAPGEAQLAISPTVRSWLRPNRNAQGDPDGYLLERLDGTALRRFD
ncbi:MAG: DPP IV N-terminal domain-containing protein [Thermoanaerobaculia bacterium]|nr:DPP IV N-terminal domain-containing protein [Thermoanaerobaculia bacterium]